MGEVFRARDTRLGRDVALKILPEHFASDPGRLRRFEKEARSASSLNHPNIVAVYEIGRFDSVSYIAMELIEGKTLRALLSSGSISTRKLLDISSQISAGLASAHEAGIIHRDLKPENVMVSKDGFAKILDFGLAKRFAFEGGAAFDEVTMSAESETGLLLGTVGYMSPEQASGGPVDFRSDQFAFGSILYEMATGKRAFERATKPQTLSAIIQEQPDPEALPNAKASVPLQWIIERCLSKDPKARYAATSDLAHDLSALRDRAADILGKSAGEIGVVAPRRFPYSRLLTAAAVVAGFTGVFFLGKRGGERPVPDFQRLTFRRGALSSARFAPDGRTIVYGAAWDGAPIRLFSTRTDGRDSTLLELPDADVFSVSSQGEIAMLLGRLFQQPEGSAGMLARVPLTGGAPREMTEAVAAADWSPDGTNLAIVRNVGGKNRVEFPIGRVLYETTDPIASLRLSPRGDRIAFAAEHSLTNSVETVDLAGNHAVLSHGWKRACSLAWSPDGSEIWFGANERGWRTPLYAVSLTGRHRLLLRLPAWINIEDVSRDGRVLISLLRMRSTVRGLAPGETQERDLSWHEGSMVKALTPDGRLMLFDEGSEGYFHTLYVRGMDGSPAKRIGEGRSMAISPDGRWVATNAKERGSQLVLLPTGAGEPKVLDEGGHRFEEAAFFPDGKRLLALGDQSCVIDLQTRMLRAIAPAGIECNVLSPNGGETACVGTRGEGVIYSIEGGASRPIPGFQAGEDSPLQWSSDGRSLFVGRGGVPLRVFRLDLATGRRELWREFSPPERAAVGDLYYFAMTPDGKSYAYSFFSSPSDLYLVTGLK